MGSFVSMKLQLLGNLCNLSAAIKNIRTSPCYTKVIIISAIPSSTGEPTNPPKLIGHKRTLTRTHTQTHIHNKNINGIQEWNKTLTSPPPGCARSRPIRAPCQSVRMQWKMSVFANVLASCALVVCCLVRIGSSRVYRIKLFELVEWLPNWLLLLRVGV